MTNANKRPNPQHYQGASQENIGDNDNDTNLGSDSPWWEKLSDSDTNVRQVGKQEWQQYQEEMFQLFHPLEE